MLEPFLSVSCTILRIPLWHMHVTQANVLKILANIGKLE